MFYNIDETSGMATVKRFEELEVWKLARELYGELGRKFDLGFFNHNFRLTNQMEGSAGSIMDNIAEGFERGSRKEFIVFLGYAKGSCGELRSQLHRAGQRRYLTAEEFERLFSKCVRISAMIQALIKHLQGANIEGTRRRTPEKKNELSNEAPLNP